MSTIFGSRTVLGASTILGSSTVLLLVSITVLFLDSGTHSSVLGSNTIPWFYVSCSSCAGTCIKRYNNHSRGLNLCVTAGFES